MEKKISFYVHAYVEEVEEGSVFKRELAKFSIIANSFQELDSKIVKVKGRIQDFVQDLEDETKVDVVHDDTETNIKINKN